MWNLNQATSRHTKCSKSKNLRIAREKRDVHTRNPHKSISGFLNRNFAGQETMR